MARIVSTSSLKAIEIKSKPPIPNKKSPKMPKQLSTRLKPEAPDKIPGLIKPKSNDRLTLFQLPTASIDPKLNSFQVTADAKEIKMINS